MTTHHSPLTNQMTRFDPSALARFGRLALVARTVVEGFLSGVHKSPYKGFSVEFAEHRQYYPGDEIRHIDWRVFGKTDRYYIKEYEEETNLQAHLLVDASGSMGYRSQASPRPYGGEGSGVRGSAPSKFEYAQFVAASLAYLMLHQLDAVGLVLHDHRLRHFLRPHSSSKHLLRVLSALEATQSGGETALAPLWHNLAGQIRRRGMIIILSDCFDEIDPLLYALRHLRHRGHEILLFHVLAPEEIEFPFSQWTQFRNLENVGEKQLVDPRQLRQEYRKNFAAFRDKLQTRARDMRIDYHLLRTDEPVEKALGAYLTNRMQRT
ncbi:MAG: DUF58 domain-containing protein [Gemmataceae bacterium]|nr:DUF58 domain-containing protein [Gemmataceae bacterium]MCI0741370.1 DUF58 domain-containing protein [Gemmataceae bacterium]